MKMKKLKIKIKKKMTIIKGMKKREMKKMKIINLMKIIYII